MSIYEIYVDSTLHWKQKVLRTRPASELMMLVEEVKQLEHRTRGHEKEVYFVINRPGMRLV